MTEALFEPAWVSPPGETIASLLELRGLDREELADAAGEQVEVVHDLLSGRAKLTKSFARALGELVGGTEDFWLTRERQYRDDLTRYRLLGGAGDTEWLAELPVAELINLGWVPKVQPRERLAAVLNYFDVPDVQAWRARYSGLVSAVSFRTSPIYSSHMGSVLAWLRMGELAATKQSYGAVNPSILRKLMPSMRALTRRKHPRDFMPILTELCGQAGVSLVVEEAPKACKASGGTWIIDDGRAVCLLSRRYRTDDQFWFTFFHEMGHLCLHCDRALFLEDGEEVRSDEEEEANQFAQDILLPKSTRAQLLQLPRTHKDVIRFARAAGVSPGIVVGQMQHMKLLPVSWLNSLKRRLDWAD